VGVDDVQFVSDLLDQLQSTLCVDPFRIYADGKSNGGGFTALLACQLQHRIAAFGMVSGAFYPQSTAGCQPGSPVSLVEFHGTADTVINYDGDDTRQGSEVPAIMDWLAGWAAHDHCATTPASTGIGTDVVKFTYPDCAVWSSVEHYRVIGGGHTWPGATVHNGPGLDTLTISATAIMWRFFLSHPLG
jgi:polyhydroxybutyrate depolymerase